ncbi:MAG: hypothetical protein AMK74_06230 [Nitrospira bacterium SM23_35]|jgi:hypothetical protein|nr:MAG: hypothetical protein AMK74_06230 [Nitrospira bacterium SM23_35]
MGQERDTERIIREFRLRQSRQFIAIGLTLFLLLLLALLYTRSDIFGVFSKSTIFLMQIVIIALFIGFSALNWRCPSCNKYLGSDINRRMCKHCRARLG